MAHLYENLGFFEEQSNLLVLKEIGNLGIMILNGNKNKQYYS